MASSRNVHATAGSRALSLAPSFGPQIGKNKVRACRRAMVQALPLGELDDESSLALARSILGGQSLSPSLVRLIRGRSLGNPLYLEEIAHTRHESGAIQLASDEGGKPT